MKKTTNFAKRNLTEMTRDPLSYIFCIAFPIIMMVIMSVVNSSIPKESEMTLFRIDHLAGGIVIFGQTFVMLFTAIMVSKDRAGSFLTRLYASPMKSRNFAGGYLLPMMIIAFVQAVVNLGVALIIALVTGYELNIEGLLVTSIAVLPSALMFTAIGFLFGTLFNDKAAPPLCSVIISLGSIIGGIWFDVESAGGFIESLSRCLPFFYCTKAARSAINMDFGFQSFVIPFIVVIGSAVLLTALSCFVFGKKMRADLS